MSTTSTSTPDVSGADSKDHVSMTTGVRLTGADNYTTWAFAMTAMLDAHGLADYVDKSKSARATDERKKARAMFAITRNIGTSHMALIKGCTRDPAGAWDILRDEYAGKSNQDTATLLIELFGKRLDPCPSIEEAKAHFERMNDLNLRLREIQEDRALPDVILSVLMAMPLPNDMEQIRYARLSGPAEMLTSRTIRDDVISLLRRMAVTDGAAANSGDAAMNANSGGGGGRRRRFRGNCFECGKAGHRAANCRQRAGPPSRIQSNSPETGVVVHRPSSHSSRHRQSWPPHHPSPPCDGAAISRRLE
ncbi:DUF4219 domain-containing protein [Plasmodiophora brassicae]